MTRQSSGIEEVIAETTNHVLPEARRYLARCRENELIPVLDYCLGAKAACDRAVLLRLGHEVCGGDWRDVVPAMVAAELMDFSVIAIDDILDEAPRRMSRESHHARYGYRTSIVAAAILKSLSAIALSECAAHLQLDAERTRQAFDILESDHLGIYTGQYLDICFEAVDVAEVSVRRFMEMIRYTTGVQIGAMAALGALLAGSSENVVETLRAFGVALGTIFQVRDDFVDYVLDESLTGKTPFLDWQRKKKRLPLLLCVETLGRNEKERLLVLFRKSQLQHEDQEFILHCINSDAVVAKARAEIGVLRTGALRALAPFADSPATDLLSQLLNLGCEL